MPQDKLPRTPLDHPPCRPASQTLGVPALSFQPSLDCTQIPRTPLGCYPEDHLLPPPAPPTPIGHEDPQSPCQAPTPSFLLCASSLRWTLYPPPVHPDPKDLSSEKPRLFMSPLSSQDPQTFRDPCSLYLTHQVPLCMHHFSNPLLPLLQVLSHTPAFPRVLHPPARLGPAGRREPPPPGGWTGGSTGPSG